MTSRPASTTRGVERSRRDGSHDRAAFTNRVAASPGSSSMDVDEELADRVAASGALRAELLHCFPADSREAGMLRDADPSREWLHDAWYRASSATEKLRNVPPRRRPADFDETARLVRALAEKSRQYRWQCPASVGSKTLRAACALCGCATTRGDLDFALEVFKRTYAEWSANHPLCASGTE